MRIAVVGCGAGGAAAATFLARTGHEVDLFERAPEIRPVGAGILLQPTGLEVLHTLGVLESVASSGASLDGIQGVTTTGTTIFRLRYDEFDIGPFAHAGGLGIHRPHLLSPLVTAATDAGARLHTGAEVITQGCPSEGRLRDTEGREHGAFDLVIAADGARSTVRASLEVVRRDREYPWGAWWRIGDVDEWPWTDRLYQIFDGTHELVGLLPTGRHADGSWQVSFFSSVPNAAVSEMREAPIDRWKRNILEVAPAARPLLDGVSHWTDLTHSTYRDVIVRPAHHGRTILIGDAAHAMSPHLGQGTNIALVDARELAAAIGPADAPTRTTAEIFREFESGRRASIRYYQFASRWATFFFQSGVPGLGWIRDRLFTQLGRIPPFRRQQLFTMAGIKTGIFRQLWRAPRPNGPRTGI